MSKHVWTKTMGSFTPSFCKGSVIKIDNIGVDTNKILAERIIEEHLLKTTVPGRHRRDYTIEDYSDEIKIYVRSRLRLRLLINLQYEGTHD